MRRRNNLRNFFLAASVATFWFVSAPAQAQKLPASTTIGTNPAGSLFYSVASGLAKVISGAAPMQAVTQPYTGNGEPRMMSRALGAYGSGFRPPIFNFGP